MKAIELNEPIIYINPFTLQKVTLTKLSVCNKAFYSLIPDICEGLGKTLQDIEQIGFEIDAPCMLDPHWYEPLRGRANGRMRTKTFDLNYWRKLDWGIKFKNYPWVFGEIDDTSHFVVTPNDINRIGKWKAPELLKRRQAIDNYIDNFFERSRIGVLIRTDLYNKGKGCLVSDKLKEIINIFKTIFATPNIWNRSDLFLFSDADDVLFKSDDAFKAKFGYSYFDPKVDQSKKNLDLYTLFSDPAFWPLVQKFSCIDFIPDAVLSKRDADPNMMLQLCIDWFKVQYSLDTIKSESSLNKLDHIKKKESILNYIKPTLDFYKPILLVDDSVETAREFLYAGYMILMPENSVNNKSYNYEDSNNKKLFTLDPQESSIFIPYNTWNQQTILNYAGNNYWKLENRVFKC